MHKELKEHFFKHVVNLCMRIMDKLMPESKAQHPQTRMCNSVFQLLFNAYCLEVWGGRFDDVPYQNLRGLQDRNFLRFLSAFRKILLYVGENDRYYRAWIGLAFIVAHQEYEQALKVLSRSEFLRQYESQWELALHCVPESHFQLHKSQFLDMMLSSHLCNLLRMRIDFDRFSASQDLR